MSTPQNSDASLRAETERRVQKIKAECSGKIAAYRDDPLFSYLDKRGYGTPQYRAFWPFHVLDAMVARICRYETNTVSYRILQQLPGYVASAKPAQRDT